MMRFATTEGKFSFFSGGRDEDSGARDLWKPGQWQHFVCSVGDSVREIYVNGVLRTRDESSFQPAVLTRQRHWIGRGANGHDIGYFHGTVGYLRVYARGMAAQEVAALHRSCNSSHDKQQPSVGGGGRRTSLGAEAKWQEYFDGKSTTLQEFNLLFEQEWNSGIALTGAQAEALARQVDLYPTDGKVSYAEYRKLSAAIGAWAETSGLPMEQCGAAFLAAQTKMQVAQQAPMVPMAPPVCHAVTVQQHSQQIQQVVLVQQADGGGGQQMVQVPPGGFPGMQIMVQDPTSGAAMAVTVPPAVGPGPVFPVAFGPQPMQQPMQQPPMQQPTMQQPTMHAGQARVVGRVVGRVVQGGVGSGTVVVGTVVGAAAVGGVAYTG